MIAMMTLTIWTITGILVAVYQLKNNKLPSWMFWITYAVLMLNLGENVLINAY